MEGLTEGSSNATIVAATIGMAQKIGLKVVAEGVATMAQLQFLRQHQCDQAQGYLFGQPCAAAEFGAYLRAYCTAPVIPLSSRALDGLDEGK
jgi:EAL domain-containing protein (putative c-di-GMP-specific phosphodiesterase class I)